VHSKPPLGGFPSEYCHAVRHGKTTMLWLPDGEKNGRYVYSFWQNARTWRTHTHTHRHIAWQHRPRLHSIARQKSRFFDQYLALRTITGPPSVVNSSTVKLGYIALSGGICWSREMDDEAPRHKTCLWQKASTALPHLGIASRFSAKG